MNATDKFVSERNVARCRERLECETDPSVRQTIIRLLVDEEDKLGATLEQLANVNRHIKRCRDLIAQQGARIAEMQSKGHDIVRAHALLETFAASLAVHEEHRDTLRKLLDQRSL
jgi:septation ring formation regulator EzrA